MFDQLEKRIHDGQLFLILPGYLVWHHQERALHALIIFSEIVKEVMFMKNKKAIEQRSLWQRNHPEQSYFSTHIWRLLHSGRISKTPCALCGETNKHVICSCYVLSESPYHPVWTCRKCCNNLYRRLHAAKSKTEAMSIISEALDKASKHR